jgi:hypothetical protein
LSGRCSGNEEAKVWVEKNPKCKSNSLIPFENFIAEKRAAWYSGGYSGSLLNAIGFSDFDPEGVYLLPGIDNNRVILVMKEVDYDPPDEYGFGAEYYYDWFYMDEFFNIIKDVPILKSMSSQDMSGCCKDQFEEMKKRLTEVLKRKS